MQASLETSIIGIINKEGPLLGKELIEKLGTKSYFDVWKACFNSGFLQISHFARYYLRYDISRKDFIRLSPSILRDFLSFTLLSLPHQRNQIIERQIILSNRHREISVAKMEIAMKSFQYLPPDEKSFILHNACAFVAGDVAYFLAHEEPRESKPLGKMIQGSDIDIIIVFNDDIDQSVIDTFSSNFLGIKHLVLKQTGFAQEIDFIAKPFSKMIDQMKYSDLAQKIASKILYESIYIFGDQDLYLKLKRKLIENGTKSMIEHDFQSALLGREQSTITLLQSEQEMLSDDLQSLFFFTQERVEFS